MVPEGAGAFRPLNTAALLGPLGLGLIARALQVDNMTTPAQPIEKVCIIISKGSLEALALVEDVLGTDNGIGPANADCYRDQFSSTNHLIPVAMPTYRYKSRLDERQ
jgi:hypothetical protein